jgi:hypothetical protein
MQLAEHLKIRFVEAQEILKAEFTKKVNEHFKISQQRREREFSEFGHKLNISKFALSRRKKFLNRSLLKR